MCCRADRKDSAQVLATSISLSRTVAGPKTGTSNEVACKADPEVKIEDACACDPGGEELKARNFAGELHRSHNLSFNKETNEITEEIGRLERRTQAQGKLMKDAAMASSCERKVARKIGRNSFFPNNSKKELCEASFGQEPSRVLRCKTSMLEESISNIDVVKSQHQVSPCLNSSERVKMAGPRIAFLERPYQL